MTERARYSIDQLTIDRSAVNDLHSNKQVYPTNETLINDTMNEPSRGIGGYHSQHVTKRQKVPGLKLPSLDYQPSRQIKTGRGSVDNDGLSGFYSVNKGIWSRDKIEINNPSAVQEILNPRHWDQGSLGSSKGFDATNSLAVSQLSLSGSKS